MLRNRITRHVRRATLVFTLLAAPTTTLLAAPQASSGDAKCLFLHEELERSRTLLPPAPEFLPLAARTEFDRFVDEVNTSIFNGKIASCGKGERLASIDRLRALETARLKHVEKIREEAQKPSAGIIIDTVNKLYETEAKSFFHVAKVAVRDRDVAKDFPEVPELLKKSGLAEEMKEALLKDFRFIKYEEAGRLDRALRGTDKGLIATFPYILRDDLGRRADAEEKQKEKDEKKRLESLARSVLQTRMILSFSLLTVIALAGFLLFKREVLTGDIYLVVVGSTFFIGLVWILVTLGVWAWIQSYLNLAL
jgi:hypothetical protein